MSYPFARIEKKWQEYWEANKTFRTAEDRTRKKMYVLDMYPYPSGSGLHVGHPEGYTATDIFSRQKRMAGYSVLHPMGWDAFGLPAERYAMQTNVHPRITTAENIATFRRQIKMLGLSYDWDREVDTTDPRYYRWTQWIFLQIYNAWYDLRANKARPVADLVRELEAHGTAQLETEEPVTADGWRRMSKKEQQELLARFRLAYIAEIPVNWCEALGTVLANEEVDEWVGKGYSVERRPLRQWMMRITAYAERLLEDAEELDWPASTLEQQRNWIGRSEGAIVRFPVTGGDVPVFTTRPDTLFGATYLVLAPEHPLVPALTAAGRRAEVEAYQASARLKSDLERGIDAEKTGVFTGSHAVNPATGKPIPVWIADYVLTGYGTGAIMAVPGHDERDYAFARKFGLPVVEVVSGGDLAREAFTGDGVAVNSRNAEVSLDGLPTPEAKRKIIAWLEAGRRGTAKVQYKLRDWLFSRQRYWGEPIPIVHLEDGTMRALDESELPLLLPELKKFQPSGTTDSPLALADDWVNVVDPATGLRGRRETNTMPQWAGSCWYYLRYVAPHDQERFCSREAERYWLPIDLYIGGSEHAVLHLMYARFWHKVLYDLGHVSTKEPFMKLRHQGLILGEDSRKMSKSMNNVVNPDSVVARYGADSMRLFEMFMGPLEEVKPWSTRGVEGVHRFLNRVWRMMTTEEGTLSPAIRDAGMTADQERLLHRTIKKVTDDIGTLNFNTAISQMMIFVNEFLNLEVKPRAAMETFVLLLSPFAPHLCEELWSMLGHDGSLACHPWPQCDEAKLAVMTFDLVVQVNGKVRAKFPVPMDLEDEEVKKLAVAHEAVARHLADKKIEKIVVVRNKLASIVAR